MVIVRKIRKGASSYGFYKTSCVPIIHYSMCEHLVLLQSRGLIGALCSCCFSGYLIPKGWRIYVYTREINYDPILYQDPLTFNPWRWLVS